MSQSRFLARTATVFALSSLALATAAQAGPRVGDVVGVPSSANHTVQARVLSSTPVVAQVAVPGQSCYDEVQQQAPRSSGAGALFGAIAGGAVGNAVGGGHGTGGALATGLGIFGGAIMGDQIEKGGNQASTRTVRRCQQQANYENRVVAYNVVYEYAGQQYTTQMQQEPGETIPLQITVTPAGAAPASVVPPAPYPPQSYEQSAAPVYVEPAPYMSGVRFMPQVVYQVGGGWWGRHPGRHWD